MDPLSIALMLAAKFAPAAIKYLTGSSATSEVVAQVIDIATTVSGRPAPADALAAIELDPALALQFRTAVMENETKLETAYLADIQSARARDVELAKAGVPNIRANVLVAASLLLVVVCLFIVVWASDMDDFGKATITLILGRSLGWVEQIFSFEFGTTRANKVKDDTIKNLSK